jgi:hypothetical protein
MFTVQGQVETAEDTLCGDLGGLPSCMRLGKKTCHQCHWYVD